MRRMICWAALALLLAGCDKEATLFSGLAESQANAALAACRYLDGEENQAP